LALQQSEIEERQAKGEKIKAYEHLEQPDVDQEKKYSLRRLDSFHLNQLTAKAFESPKVKQLQAFTAGASPV